MRDTAEGMPEILDALELDGLYFGMVRIELSGTPRQFQFGVSVDGYRALRKVLQLHPFDSMPGLEHKHFFAGSYGRIPDSSDCTAFFRVEQNRDAKQIEVRVPKELLSNLIWFAEIKDPDEAAHLKEIE